MKQRALVAAALVGLGIALTAPASSAQDRRTSKVHVLLINQALVPSDVLSRAQANASRIYAAAGVEIVWLPKPGELQPIDSSFTLMLVPKAISTSTRLALGTALANRYGAGRKAYAFIDQVTSFAVDRRQSLSSVLGHVIAHELGHLLIGNNSHAATGIMRGQWRQQEITLLAAGLLTFTADNAMLMRTNARRLSTK